MRVQVVVQVPMQPVVAVPVPVPRLWPCRLTRCQRRRSNRALWSPPLALTVRVQVGVQVVVVVAAARAQPCRLAERSPPQVQAQVQVQQARRGRRQVGRRHRRHRRGVGAAVGVATATGDGRPAYQCSLPVLLRVAGLLLLCPSGGVPVGVCTRGWC